MTRKLWALVIASVLVSVILLAGQVLATDADGRKKIVVFLDGTPLAVQQTVVALSGSTAGQPLSFINAWAITLPVLNPDQALAFLLNYTVVGVHPVVGVYDDLLVSVLPITPALPGQVPVEETYDWGLVHIGADVAHQEMPTWKGQGVNVAILDTGVDCGHPDLPLVIDGFNALPGGVSYCDDHGHGTHIAGIIAARQNNIGIIGVAPQASLVAVKVLDANGTGYLSNLINGLQWIYNNQIQKQIRLVNMSLGFSVDSPPLRTAIEKLFYDHGTIMVAAAGNSCPSSGGQEEAGGDEGQGACPQTTTVMYPAAYSAVLAVTATNSKDQITDYSLAGSAVDVTAPGGMRKDKRIFSTYLGGLYGFASGTSQAAAHVTGTVALRLQQQPTLVLDDVRWLLQQTATVLPGYPRTQQGRGLIDAESLLAAPQ
jgi:subtilisin family serine protease